MNKILGFIKHLSSATRSTFFVLMHVGKRCLWIASIPALLTLVVLAIPQGGEFFYLNNDWRLHAITLIYGIFFILLIGSVAAWRFAPSNHIDDDKRFIIVSWHFAFCFTSLVAVSLVSIVLHYRAPESVFIILSMLSGGIVFLFFTYIGSGFGVHELDIKKWPFYVLTFSNFLLLTIAPSSLVAALVLPVGYLFAHIYCAAKNPELYEYNYENKNILHFGASLRKVVLFVGMMVSIFGSFFNGIWPDLRFQLESGPLAVLLSSVNLWIFLAFIPFFVVDCLKHKLSNCESHNRVILIKTLNIIPAAIFAIVVLSLYNGKLQQVAIRVLPDNGRTEARPSQSVEQKVQEQISSLMAFSDSSSASIPIVLIAAEGGGIRSAYWTSALLERLSERYKGFSSSVLALSGVSGGAVGVVLYAATTQHRSKNKFSGAAPIEAKKVAGSDFFSPVLHSLLVSEPIRDIFMMNSIPDRAASLEKSFSERYKQHTDKNTMEESFCDLQRTGFPMILPGLTDATTGKRAVLSCFPLEKRISVDITEPLWIPEGHRLRASTAAFLSARFPIVSPTGLLSTQFGKLSLVDGGYSDNSGTGTIVEILQIIREMAAKAGVSDRIKPIIILTTTSGQAASNDSSLWRNGAIGLLAEPPRILDTVRARIAQDYRRWLKSNAGGKNITAEVIEFSLSDEASGTYPLGWMLSPRTQSKIDERIKQVLNSDATYKLESITGWKAD